MCRRPGELHQQKFTNIDNVHISEETLDVYLEQKHKTVYCCPRAVSERFTMDLQDKSRVRMARSRNCARCDSHFSDQDAKSKRVNFTERLFSHFGCAGGFWIRLKKFPVVVQVVAMVI